MDGRALLKIVVALSVMGLMTSVLFMLFFR
jgi:hypothetical protein